MKKTVHSVNTVDGQEPKHKLILDSEWMERNAESSKLLALKSLSLNSIDPTGGNQVVVNPSSMPSNASIASEAIEQPMYSARSIDLNQRSGGANTPDIKLSPRTPIQVKNEITSNVDLSATTIKVVKASGNGSTRKYHEERSSRPFRFVEPLDRSNMAVSTTGQITSGGITITGVPLTAAASYVMVSGDMSSTVDARRVDNTRIIRRGFSDDISNMMKRSGNRLVKTQSNNSARSSQTPAEYGHVYLNIYDLEAVNKVVNVVAGTFGAGAYHAGVEIYGHEYNFGYTPQGGTGIVRSYPRFHASHKYRKSIDLGKTKYSPREVLEIVDRLKPLWLGSSYDILKKNCLNFADAFCKELDLGGIPPWVMGLQNKINWTRESLQSGAAKLRQLDEAVGISRAFGSLSRKLTGECTRGNN
ncbi:hypothetical protein X943_002908 [Babesia divergens]|uniref:PPPDE domain-containing protein n=1 Tax=Babesia divergens TaxID=32595 RepID=A0AAD9GJL6_BABDI|nr:hypothetical protein X943_002908 [Babesia divergens]